MARSAPSPVPSVLRTSFQTDFRTSGSGGHRQRKELVKGDSWKSACRERAQRHAQGPPADGLGEPPLPGKPPSSQLHSSWLPALGQTQTARDWQQLGLGACRVPSWNEKETYPAMRSRGWHQCLPREPSSASQDIPNCEQNMGGRPARLGPCQVAPSTPPISREAGPAMGPAGNVA